MNGRRSRSRSGDRRRGGGLRRSPQQERPAYSRRSHSRSGSRGRDSRRNGGGNPNNNFNNGGNFSNDAASAAAKRRSKFSDSGLGGGGGGGFSDDRSHGSGRNDYYGMASIPGHGGFQNENPAVMHGNNYNNNNNYRNQNQPPPPPQHQQQQQQNRFDEMDRYGGGGPPQYQQQPPAPFTATFHSTNQSIPSDPVGFDPSLITITPLRTGNTRISRKVYIPQDNKFNYIGLIIGPKGSNQKQLEEDTNCKILIRGKGSQKQGQPSQPDDDEDLHVLIEADNEANANKAMREIETIILMDEEEKSKKRDQQLRSAHTANGGRPNEFSCTDPDKLNFIIVPNNCVGLVIGRKGETIKQIKDRSGADRVYMQSEANRNMSEDYQNLIVEGTQESVEKVREIIEDIKVQQRRKSGGGDLGVNRGGNDRPGDQQQQQQRNHGYGQSNGEARIEMEIPSNMAGLVIGKQGSTLQQVGQQTRTHCQMQQNSNQVDDGKKILIITGPSEADCQQAKAIFQDKINARMNVMTIQNAPRLQGPPAFGGMATAMFPPPPRPFGGRPPFQNKRPRKNADGDEIVDDANQYEYTASATGYETDPMMMQNQMYANMYMQYQGQYPGYPVPPEPLDPYAAQQQQQVSQVHSDASGMVAQDPAAAAGAAQDPKTSMQQPPQYPSQFDAMQIQMQLQYQQQLYYQQYQQMQNVQPMIQEVLADGTVVTVSQEEEEGRRGKRGGRR